MKILNETKNKIKEIKEEQLKALGYEVFKNIKEKFPQLHSITYFVEVAHAKHAVLTGINNLEVIYTFLAEYAEEAKSRLVEMNFTEDEYKEVSELLNLSELKQLAAFLVPAERIHPAANRHFTFIINNDGTLTLASNFP